jgi:hypothetical protein
MRTVRGRRAEQQCTLREKIDLTSAQLIQVNKGPEQR